jgi:hypothetical protein
MGVRRLLQLPTVQLLLVAAILLVTMLLRPRATGLAIDRATPEVDALELRLNAGLRASPLKRGEGMQKPFTRVQWRGDVGDHFSSRLQVQCLIVGREGGIFGGGEAVIPLQEGRSTGPVEVPMALAPGAGRGISCSILDGG